MTSTGGIGRAAAQAALTGKVVGISDTSQKLKSLSSAKTVAGGVGSTQASLTQRTKWYRVPTGSSPNDLICLIRYFMLCAVNDDSLNRGEWKNLLASMVGALYTDSITQAIGFELDVVRLSQGEMHAICESVNTLLGLPDMTPDKFKMTLTKHIGVLKKLQLPSPGDWALGAFAVEAPTTAYYAYLGVIAMAAVKDASGTGEQALTTNRFRAILSKYHWAKEDFPFLGGDLAPSTHAFTMFNHSWTLLPSTRRLFFTNSGKITELGGSAEDEAFLTTFRLMKFSDMTHIAIINGFLDTYSWAVKLGSLQRSVINYTQEVDKMYNMCPQLPDERGLPQKTIDGLIIRDATLLPYVKAIHQDSLDIGNRNLMLPLLYVAHRALMEDDPNLASYVVPENYPGAWAEFSDARVAYNATIAQAADE